MKKNKKKHPERNTPRRGRLARFLEWLAKGAEKPGAAGGSCPT